MKSLIILTFITLLLNTSPKSQDYARHIELSLLFYECQRSGPLPETNRIYWRHDSMVDAGKDVGLDLTGGYYDAGDNCKFNFPMSSSITLLVWSGIEFKDAYKKANQWENFLEAIKWATDYFVKCHPSKDVLYVQVGDGNTDHSHWYPPEYIDYEYPSYKVDADGPGSEVAGETAACLAAASILFKDEDSVYSATLLKHAIEIYDFADTYRGDYTASVPVQAFYGSYSGYRDELAWGALWLYRATNEESYMEKFKAIADYNYVPHDLKKYLGADGPISWDDKRPGCYILAAMLTKDESRIKVAEEYCDLIISQPTTAGGLYYPGSLSQWASNRYASNAASMVVMYATTLPANNAKREKYIKFCKSQIDYILGDNPMGVNYVVGAEENSPKAVHHRGASGTFDSQDASAKPDFNVYTLYGALAGGPGKDDNYIDNRSNYEMNEVATDYNAAFTLNLAALIHFGYGVEDTGDILNFDRAWPQKAPTPDIRIKMTEKKLSIATGSGMMCSNWCVTFKSNMQIDGFYDSTPIIREKPNYKVCNKRGTGFLDGEGTFQDATMNVNWQSTFEESTEFEVLCDGFHPTTMETVYQLIPEYGHSYKVTGNGGPENTKALFEESECWPAFIC